jgi:hypothetical protein
VITELTKQSVLSPLQGVNLPYLLAEYWYQAHSDLNFLVDVNHYLSQGQLLSTPAVFVMGKPVMLESEPAFFVRFACGRLNELVKHLPEGIKWIAFCRNNRGNVRKYRIDRMSEIGIDRIGQLTSPIFSMNMETNGSEPLM